MSTSVSCSIIIVNWNVCDLLRDCLQSIYEHTRLSPDKFEIIVVDNASSDGSVAMLRLEFPQVILIENDSNPGYGRGAENAYELANGEVLWFLNPDTLLLDDAVTTLLSKFELEPQLGAVAPRLLNADRTFQRAAAGAFPTIFNAACNYLFLNRVLPESWAQAPMFLEKDIQGTFEMDWVSGAAIMVRKEAFGEYSAEDPFFTTCDDFDICERIRQQGWTVKYSSDCTVLHFQWRSLAQQTDSEILWQAHRGGPRRFFVKNHGALACFTYDSVVATGHLIRWFLYSNLAMLRRDAELQKQSAFSRQYLAAMVGRWWRRG